MVPRMGRKKALIAIANLMLRLIYHLLKTKSTYNAPFTREHKNCEMLVSAFDLSSIFAKTFNANLINFMPTNKTKTAIRIRIPKSKIPFASLENNVSKKTSIVLLHFYYSILLSLKTLKLYGANFISIE